jgi:hypothetical protein
VSRDQSILTALEARYEATLEESGKDLAFKDFRKIHLDYPKTEAEIIRAFKDLIRDQRGPKGYTSFEKVGREDPGVFFARLAMVRLDEGPYLGESLPHLQQVLDMQIRPVQEFFDRGGIYFPYPVLVKLSPTGELNAEVVRVPEAGGAIVLVNAGLMDLVFRVLKIYTAGFIRGSSPPVLAGEQATMALAEAFNAYLYAGSSHFAWPLPEAPQDQKGHLNFLLRRAEQFVMCHEFGHIILGHVPLESPLRLTPQLELQADDFATMILYMMLSLERNFRKLAGHLCVSVFSFFATASAIEQLRATFNLDRSAKESHPGLLLRREWIEHGLVKRLPGRNLLNEAYAFEDWMNKQLRSVISVLQEVNDNVNRSGRWDPPV